MAKGSCLCGNITYEVEIEPDNIFNCHCRFCRKAHGADYVTVAIVKAATLKLVDEKRLLKEHMNAIGGIRAFCSECGTRLMNYAPDRNLYCSVALSTVDTPLHVAPVAHVNTESKASWCEPYAGIPQFKALPAGLV